MRRGRDQHVLLNKDEKVCAVSLGADFTAEHEWGIKRLKDSFGISDELTRENAGKAYRSVTRCVTKPSGEFRPYLYTHDFKLSLYDRDKKKQVNVNTRALLFYESIDSDYISEKWKGKCPSELPPFESKFELSSAWDERTFGLLVKKESSHIVDDLYSALASLDACIWLGGGGVFQNSGLCIGIASRMDPEIFEAWRKSDLDHLDLIDADEKTGIKKRLKEANLDYFALSPKWSREFKSTRDGDVETKYDVMYWLNPREQQKYNFGWYTVEQLEQWIEGKGPITVPRK